MKLLKKFGKGIIAVVLCLLLATTVLAVATATYTAVLDDAVICANELTEAKTVTLTVKVDQEVEMDAFTAQVKAPEDWEITGIANGNLNSSEFNFYLDNGMILWYSGNAEPVTNDLLATVTIQVPANTPAGEYEIVFELIDISREYGMPWEDGEVLTAKLTVADHADGDDANHDCDVCGGVVEGETCHGGTATCTDKAVCAECGQPYGDVDKNNHTGEVVYTNNGDTHSAVYNCCGAAYVTDEAHDFTNGDCVCGAKDDETSEDPIDPDPTDPDPSEPVTGLKGDVDLDGKVTSSDVTRLLEHVAGIKALTEAEAIANGEVTGDGELTSADVTKILEYVAGIINSLG